MWLWQVAFATTEHSRIHLLSTEYYFLASCVLLPIGAGSWVTATSFRWILLHPVESTRSRLSECSKRRLARGTRYAAQVLKLRAFLSAIPNFRYFLRLDDGDVYSFGWNESGQLGVRCGRCPDCERDLKRCGFFRFSGSNDFFFMNVPSRGMFHFAFSAAAVEPAVQVASEPQIVSLNGSAGAADAGDVLIESLACGWRHSALLTGTRCALPVHWRCFQMKLLHFCKAFFLVSSLHTCM